MKLAKVQTLDSPDTGGPFQHNPSLSNMLSQMATHSRRIQDRIPPEAPRTRATAHNASRGPLFLPSQESIIYSLYATPASSPDYSVVAYDHRFPQNVVRPQQRPPTRRHPPPPLYSEMDPNASISLMLSEMGLCVRGGVAPQLPPPYSSLPDLSTPIGD